MKLCLGVFFFGVGVVIYRFFCLFVFLLPSDPNLCFLCFGFAFFMALFEANQLLFLCMHFNVAFWSRSLQQGFSNKRLRPEYSRGMQRLPSSGRFPKNTSAMPWTVYKDLRLYINCMEIVNMGMYVTVICVKPIGIFTTNRSPCCSSSTISGCTPTTEASLWTYRAIESTSWEPARWILYPLQAVQICKVWMSCDFPRGFLTLRFKTNLELGMRSTS